MRDCITGYKFFVDFSKTQSKVQELEKKLKIMSTLIGSDNIEQDFEDLIVKYPEVLSCIPILLAVRNNELLIKEEGQIISFSFDMANNPIEKYQEFMKETGLFDLLSKRQVKSLSDYVFGIEVGLDSHSRKNRIGTEMESLVCKHIQNAGYELGKNFLTQTSLQKALEK
ncbi:hypothetical protein B4U78_016455 [Microbacterium esteraromaticum]|nr:hypothetical protein B4U78_016455 [Microbacterium esteraromaticum]